MTQRFSLFLLLALCGAILPACGSDKKASHHGNDSSVDGDAGADSAVDDAGNDAAVAAENPTVRGVHATSLGGAVNVYVNAAFTVPVFQDLAFAHATAALTVPAGDYSVQLVSTDVTAPTADDVIGELETTTLAVNENYTLIALGDAFESDTPVVVQAYTDLLPPDDGKVRIRFINGSPDTGNITVADNNGPTTLASDIVPFADGTFQVTSGEDHIITVTDGESTFYYLLPAQSGNTRLNLVFTRNVQNDGVRKVLMHKQGTDEVSFLDDNIG